MDLRVIRANKSPTTEDVRALKAFLESSRANSEKELQRLLERHPALVGVLGFSEFLSEVPIYKVDENNEPVLLDLRKRDRADLIAAAESPILSTYRSANIIELKGAVQPIRDRSVGAQLSDVANHAVGQLEEYRTWLTTIPANRTLMKSIGWDVRLPELSLIMGRRDEFTENPGQFAEIRSKLKSKGVDFYTVDDIFDRARRDVEQRVVPSNVMLWSGIADARGNVLPGMMLRNFPMALEIAVSNPASLATMPEQVFNELVLESFIRNGYDLIAPSAPRKNGVYLLSLMEGSPAVETRILLQCVQKAILMNDGRKALYVADSDVDYRVERIESVVAVTAEGERMTIITNILQPRVMRLEELVDLMRAVL